MPVPTKKLSKFVAALEKLYGRPRPLPASGPLELILWENIAYLADDARRTEAWRQFRERVGTKPEKILAAPRRVLEDIAGAGILASDRVAKLREVAAIALSEFGGALDTALDVSPEKASRQLRKFPSIGQPGAEKILLFTRRQPVLALDSNGLRVLLRLGYGREQRNYAASYRSAQEATRPEWKDDFDWLIGAHQLLRRHGQELCKAKHPRCEACPLRKGCTYFRSFGPEA
jgi:endonuclease-3